MLRNIQLIFYLQKAIHLPTKDIVALKIVKLDDEDNLEAMLGEVRIMKLCNHPHIVKFYGAWFREEEIFVRNFFIIILMQTLIILLQIAMELCGGGSVLDLYQSMFAQRLFNFLLLILSLKSFEQAAQ